MSSQAPPRSERTALPSPAFPCWPCSLGHLGRPPGHPPKQPPPPPPDPFSSSGHSRSERVSCLPPPPLFSTEGRLVRPAAPHPPPLWPQPPRQRAGPVWELGAGKPRSERLRRLRASPDRRGCGGLRVRLRWEGSQSSRPKVRGNDTPRSAFGPQGNLLLSPPWPRALPTPTRIGRAGGLQPGRRLSPPTPSRSPGPGTQRVHAGKR